MVDMDGDETRRLIFSDSGKNRILKKMKIIERGRVGRPWLETKRKQAQCAIQRL